MHFFASKRTRIFLPSTISMALMSGSLSCFRANYATQERGNASHCTQFNDANDRRFNLTHVTHSKMLETRRRRTRAVKDSAGAAKLAKKTAKRDAKKAGAGAAKPA
jgi:hypothetical protein